MSDTVSTKISTQNRNLNMLIAGRFLTDSGNYMQLALIPLYILNIGGGAESVGIFLMVSLLPMVLLAPVAGVIGDRGNRKSIMVLCDLLSAICAFTLVVLTSVDMLSLLLLFLFQALLGVNQIFFESSSGGMVPRLVMKSQLASANSKIAIAKIVSTVLGPVVGASLFTRYGIEAIFLVNAISFLLSALLETQINYTHTKRDINLNISSLVADILSGAAFVRKERLILYMFIYFAVISFTLGPLMQVAIPIVYKNSAMLPDAWYGVFQSFSAVGGLIGAIIAGRVIKRYGFHKSFASANILIILVLLVMAWIFVPFVLKAINSNPSDFFILLGACLLLLTTGFMFVSIPVQTMIQNATPEEYLSRVYSLLNLTSKGALPLGAILFGYLLEIVPAFVVVIMTVAVLLPSIGIIFHMVTTLEQLGGNSKVRNSEIKSKQHY